MGREREHMLLQETHQTPCQEVLYGLYRRTTASYSQLLYGSSATQTSVTLLLLRHRILDAAERQHGMYAIRTGASDTLADSIYE